MNAKKMVLKFKSGEFDLSEEVVIMGVLNVTPDSFSDGGMYNTPEKALKRAEEMIEQGAKIIDIGGESTRPGSESVSEEEELRRVLPVIQEMKKKKMDCVVSVDTHKYKVAREVISVGADIINVITGLRVSQELTEILAAEKVGVIIMHIKGQPKTMQVNPIYEDVISEVKGYFREEIMCAKKHGIDERYISIDPGIGFGKRLEDNLKIIKHLGSFTEFNLPVCIGVSRKSFIGAILDLPVSERLEGTAASVAISVLHGANIVRVHDVKEMLRVVKIAKAIKSVS